MSQSASTPLSHLSRVWKILHGKDLNFVACLTSDIPPSQDLCFSLDITVQPGEPQEHGLALLLLLSRDDAGALASLMFDQPPESLGDADLIDACSEICNVLANRVLLDLTPEQVFDIGSVQRLSGPDYLAALDRTRVRSLYRCVDHEHPMYVLVCESPQG